jgi:hypothetical protein
MRIFLRSPFLVPGLLLTLAIMTPVKADEPFSIMWLKAGHYPMCHDPARFTELQTAISRHDEEWLNFLKKQDCFDTDGFSGGRAIVVSRREDIALARLIHEHRA